MSVHAALLPELEILSNSAHKHETAPSATWKLGILVLSGLPEGPAAWALKNSSGSTFLRGWVGAESGRAAIQLPRSVPMESSLEIRSGISKWNLVLPPRKPAS